MQNQKSHKGIRTTLIGILVSALLALVKGVGGIVVHSYALVADAIESTADVFTSAMLLLGLRWSGRPPDESHPYGHGKGEALISLGIALALIVAALIIIRQSILHILNPHSTPATYTLIILVLVVVTKELLYRFVMKTGEEINSGAVKADAFHHRSDAITSAAAFIGITIALIGGDGYEVADDYAALVAGAFIIYNAITIARPAIGELLDEAIDPAFRKQLTDLAMEVKGVMYVQKIHAHKPGTAYHVDMHVWVDGQLSVQVGHEISHNVKDYILRNAPSVSDVHIHIEPYSEPVNALR